jgi:carboxypeptidase family protein
MPWAQVFKYAASISSVLSLAAFLGALYIWLQSRKSEQSVVEIVKGQGVVDAATVVRVLKQFKSDEARLAALQHMLGYDASRAADVLQKVKANVDVQKLSLQSRTDTSRRLANTGVVMVILTAIATWGTLKTEPVSTGNGSHQDDSILVSYTGTVRNAKTKKPVGGAKVAITEDQEVPQRFTTDSDGVFFAKLHKNANTVLLTIDADGYKEYTRRTNSVRTGSEEILIEPVSDPPEPAVADIVARCYRRALFTRMQAQLSTKAMVQSIDICRLAIETDVPNIHRKDLGMVAANLLITVDQLLRTDPDNSQNWPAINALKLEAIQGFKQLASATGGSYPLPNKGKLIEKAFFTDAEASKPPTSAEIEAGNQSSMQQ